MLQHVSESLSFWMLNNTPAYTYTTFCLPVHLLMDLGLLPPFGYSELCCCEHGYIKYFSLPSGTYPEAGLLDHTVILILIFFEELPYCYIKVSKDNKITQKWSVEETELKWHKVISLASLKLIINIFFGLGFSLDLSLSFNSGYRVKMVLFLQVPEAHDNSLSLLENACGGHSGGGSRIEQKVELSCQAGIDGSLAQPSRGLRNQNTLSHNSVLGRNSSLHTLVGHWMWAV